MVSDEVIVIGGGIIGVSTAYFLARQGVPVTLIEKGKIAAGSSYGNAGLLCPCHSSPLPAPGVLSQGLKWLFDAQSPFYVKPRLDLDFLTWLWRFRSFCNQESFDRAVPLLRDMQRASLALYHELIAHEKLQCHFVHNGGLSLYLTERGFEHGRHEAQQMQRFGLQMSLIDGDTVREMETAVHPNVFGAVHYQEDAHITPDLFVKGLAQAAQGQGATILTDTAVTDFLTKGRHIVGVKTTQGTINGSQIVLAAGVWSAPIAKQLGCTLPLQPAKGYSVTIKRSQSTPQKYLYLSEAKVAVTPMGPHVRYAGTLELAGFDFSINQRRVQGIINAADKYLVNDGEREVVETWRGMRPCSPDGLPYIGRFSQFENMIVATGHAMLGMSMGPITGQLVAEMIQEQRPSLPIEPFQVERFRKTSRKSANQS